MAVLKQLNFAGGELSPSLHFHNDLSKYQSGLRTLRNMFVKKDGGVSNRHGSKFTSSTFNNGKARVIEFSVTGDLSLGLEFTDEIIRVLRGGLPVANATTPLVITSFDVGYPTIVHYTGVDPTNGTQIILSGTGTGPLNNSIFRVDNVNAGANTFQLLSEDGANDVDSTNMTLAGGGSVSYVLIIDPGPNPYAIEDVPYIDYAQSVDVMTLVHPLYPVQEIRMTTYPNVWTRGLVDFVPAMPANLSSEAAVQSGVTASTTYKYALTSIDTTTSYESDPTYFNLSNANPAFSATNFININWNALAVDQVYNVYKEVDGIYYLLGTSRSTVTGLATRFQDTGQDVDRTATFDMRIDPFSGAGNYPSCVAYIVQRSWYGNTVNNPETVYGSALGRYNTFLKRQPGQPVVDDGSIEFNLAGRTRNPVDFLLDLNGFVMFTDKSEWGMPTNQPITPTSIGPTAQSYNGTKRGLRPLVLNDTAVYVQNRGSIIRELGFTYEKDGYRGDDLTVFSAHLFKNKDIVDWCYQQTPDSIIWAVSDDGVLLSLTHIKEQEILGWAHHDFEDGFVENVYCIQEDRRDVVYAIVRRTIGVTTRRYHERIEPREIQTLDDCKFLDSHLTYDGRNTDLNIFMRIDDPSDIWDYETEMEVERINTLTPADNLFTVDDIGKHFHLTSQNGDGELIRFTITNVVDTLGVITAFGKPNRTVPASLRDLPAYWSEAINVVTGLQHLAGEDVSVFADGNVVGSVHNSEYGSYTVTENPGATLPLGAIQLDKYYSLITVGIPITADFETLSIDSLQGETLINRQKNIGQVTLGVEKSRGIFLGGRPPIGDDYLEGLNEAKLRNTEGYDEPTQLFTGALTVIIQSHWNSNGRIFGRQIDPLPLDLLAVSPEGLIPFKG